MRGRNIVAVLATAAILLGTLIFTGSARAQQAYPTHAVRLILPFNPGSATDTTARLFADRLTARWGKPVVVENRPGGDGLVALKVFIDAHDDHTLFFGPAAAFLVHLYDQEAPPYTLSDIAPVAGVYVTVLAISVPTALGVNTMDDLVALARKQPGMLNVAAATGNSDFLIFGFMKDMGLQVTRVPYRDIMLAPNDLSQSRIQVLSSSLAAVQSTLQTGRVKVLLVTSRKRAETAPDIPTAAEAGYPQLTMETAGGLYGPKEMPDAERDSIAADFRDVAEHDPIIRQRLVDTGQIMNMLRPAEFAANIKEQNDQLAAIAKSLGLKQ
ncbi:MAG TPA: tripartite tricarboxylate transporter substrate binding protein [Xanthobacteraceae bacterium]|jgi:tripartite-type tricarboxylate transporter receptor subunit TctC|nr:tripartite tricarboxylate transporter substrate binding protein [Xanthobacteraceae bacterium]